VEGLSPKIWEGKKPSKIFRNFWQLSTLIANISGADPQIENRKSKKQLINYDHSHVELRKVFELWSTNETVIDVSIDPP